MFEVPHLATLHGIQMVLNTGRTGYFSSSNSPFGHVDPCCHQCGHLWHPSHLDGLFGKQTVLVDGQDTTILRQRLVEEAAPVMAHVKGSEFLKGGGGWAAGKFNNSLAVSRTLP